MIAARTISRPSKLTAETQARPEASTRQGCDLFHYDIELAYNGTVYRISSVELGAEEALAGVMFAANSLIDAPRDPIHAMSLHPATV